MPTTTVPEVELYVRSLASRSGCQRRMMTQLQALDASGDVDGVDVRVWGSEVCISEHPVETESRREILNTVGAFREWADRNGVSMEQCYENRTRVADRTGEEFTTLRLPVLALAEYEDGELAWVTPHERDGRTQTVAERVEKLATEVGETPHADPAES